MAFEETELDRAFTRWLEKQTGPRWPRSPGFHTRQGQRNWSGGAPWTYDGRAWWVRLGGVPRGFAGRAWALGLLEAVPAEHMPAATRDGQGRWVVQLHLEGRAWREVDVDACVAVARLLMAAYPLEDSDGS
jgi:hypothetical protein